MLRKLLVAALVGGLSVLVVAALPFIDAVEKQDWASAKTLAVALVFAVVAGVMRAVVAYLTAFVPSDADQGLNLLGKYK